MFNEEIHAFPLLDRYEALKRERKTSDKEHLAQLHKMLEHYGKFHKIMGIIETSGAKSSLWWPCVQLEESMWEAIRLHLLGYGYDPRWIQWKNGKYGLQGYEYNDGIPCEFDEILITYDGMERMEHPIPVRKNGKCGLVMQDGTGREVFPFKYDLLFREPYSEIGNYIAINDGKYGIVDWEGNEVIPCILDCIYEKPDHDSFLPLYMNGKWGLYSGGATFVLPKFDELEIHCEDFLRARIGHQWGWVTLEGELTQDKGEANYGSWYEWGK